MNNLSSINGDLWISDNATLINVTGLDSLHSIANDLMIGDYPAGNPVLSSLTGLKGLKTLEGEIIIGDNNILTSLSGLENVLADSIKSLLISGNAALSSCEIKSICEYLKNPGGPISIQNKFTGCNSQAEVEEACSAVSVDKITSLTTLDIYPTPTSSQLTIETSAKTAKKMLTILNLCGKELISCRITEPKTCIYISNLPSGVYFVRLTGETRVEMAKLIKQ